VIAYPESRAAVAAARRAARIPRARYDALLGELEDIRHELILLDADEPLARRAGDLAEQHALRGYDAVHLATALALGDDVVVVTWDRDLSTAAAACGCATAGISSS
jgi:uncharacterized protein